MNHSVTHKDAAEPQKIDGQNAVIVEKKSEELEDSKFDLGGYENPYQYLKQFLRTTDETAADKVADAVMRNLTGQGQEKLLKSLIEHACCSFDKKISATADMNALRKDLKPGEYPYVNGYNRDLYNKQLRSLQIELLKLQSWIQKKGNGTSSATSLTFPLPVKWSSLIVPGTTEQSSNRSWASAQRSSMKRS